MKTIDILKKYFKEDKLEVLDGGQTYKEFDTYHYGAVSLTYLHKYLFKEKITKKYIAKVLFELCKQKILRPIPCTFANDLVFIRYDYFRKGFLIYKIENDEIINPYKYYKSFDIWLNNFNMHLKSNIKL